MNSKGIVLVASANGLSGMAAAWDILASGGAALDAVEAGTRVIEDDPTDHTVGYGGYPNLAGDVELDASIMDGSDRRAGAVGALKGYRHAISVARAVMERLPHVLLVGDGAARFAEEIGMDAENLLTEEAAQVWRAGLEGRLPKGTLAGRMLSQMASLAADPEHAAGTVNFLARDAEGHIASAVSTSGWAWKYPGRLGDTPVIGAGNYADDRWGAAACTGWGEAAVRSGTAGAIVAALRRGSSLKSACEAAIEDVASLGGLGQAWAMHAVAIDAAGNDCGISTRPGTSYAVQRDGMAAAELVPRTIVDLAR